LLIFNDIISSMMKSVVAAICFVGILLMASNVWAADIASIRTASEPWSGDYGGFPAYGTSWNITVGTKSGRQPKEAGITVTFIPSWDPNDTSDQDNSGSLIKHPTKNEYVYNTITYTDNFAMPAGMTFRYKVYVVDADGKRYNPPQQLVE
jgi:hypothetical protein